MGPDGGAGPGPPPDWRRRLWSWPSPPRFVVWAPWPGWPHVFAATALGLVVEHRRRVGFWNAATATAGVLAGFVFAVATLLCLFTSRHDPSPQRRRHCACGLTVDAADQACAHRPHRS
jgi:hypothetical protein